MITIRVEQDGNLVFLQGLSETIEYALEGVDLPPIRDHSFALWHVLPWAMTHGEDIHIDGPVDPEVLRNARKMVRTWEMWVPQEFKSIEISAAETRVHVPPQSEPIVLWSGGVDSTAMLLRRGRQASQGIVLTVHGMEFRHFEEKPFKDLVARTEPILRNLNYRRIVLRTNAKAIATGYHSYGMMLAGNAFLLSGIFSGALFAADCTPEQDMVIHPWGLNHVTNGYLAGTGFKLLPQVEDLTRSNKVEMIFGDEVSLHAVTFCKNKQVRPANCGRCEKCLRTKAIFKAVCGEIPKIFLDHTFAWSDVEPMVRGSSTERAFFLDLYQEARDKGNLEPDLVRIFRTAAERPCAPAKPRGSLRRFFRLWAPY